jgi:Pentapeptide repeats (8 copies)
MQPRGTRQRCVATKHRGEKCGCKTNLSYARLHNSNLQGANLRGANLRWACLVGTDLQNADLTRADLTQATFWHPNRCVPSEMLPELTPEQRREAGYVPPNLAGADLTGAILIAADLIDADLSGVEWTSVCADVRTRWPEGFDPQQHGVEIRPLAAEWQLKRGELVLGTLHDCRPDYRPHMPWFRARFAPTAAFEEVLPLFDEAARRRESRQLEEYIKTSEAINALGLRLESPDGEILSPHLLDIEGGKVRFRY